MNANLSQLFGIAQKTTRRIIGLMSGTSMDGLDVALCTISGSGTASQLTLEQFETVAFGEEIKDEIRRVFAKKEIDFQHLCLLNPWIGQLHGKIVLACLRKWGIRPDEIDLIASHGQTVFHAPKSLHQFPKYPNATLQIGDGDHVAVATGIITVSDFRQKHCAAGGEGAPLAVYGDYLIFSKKDENRLMLNMGGIANFTYLPGNLNPEEVFVTDTGPGNTLIDAFMRKFFNLAYDEGGKFANSGKVHQDLLSCLKKEPFFHQSFPKTTGPELFNLSYVRLAQQRSGTTSLAPEDMMATLTRFSAETIAEAILKVCKEDQQYHLYLSGGGMHNPVLINYLHQLLPTFQMNPTDILGISGDAKEAVLFAILANETVCGNQFLFGKREGVPSVSMGKLSFPH